MKTKLLLVFVVFFSFLSCNSESEEPNQNENYTTTINSSFYNANTPDGALRLFLERLGNRDYSGAYELQKNDEWGTPEKFSSKSSFGGIVKTSIKTIESPKDEAGKKMIYAEVTYYDEENGDKTFKQNFYLQSFGGIWKIVDMKVVKDKDDKNEKAILSIAGKYSFYYTEDVSSQGIAEISVLNDKSVNYKISITSLGITEFTEGVAIKKSSNIYEAKSEKLVLQFSTNKLEVTDKQERTYFELTNIYIKE